MPIWITLNCALAAATATALAVGQTCSSTVSPSAMSDAPPTGASGSAATSDIVDTAVAAGSFKTLAAALTAAGLVDTLKGAGPFTVFAPTDDAFAKLPKGTLEDLLKPQNRAQLVAILTYHVVPGSVDSTKVVSLRNAGAVNGQRIDIAANNGKVRLDGRANVIRADIKCSNGVIHVIDEVMLPEQKDVLGVASGAGSFNTLAAAIQAAGLTDALKDKGPFTVFAPTDAAFKKLPPETLASLLKPENKAKLAEILMFHVVPGRIYADGVAGATESPKTLAGRSFMIKSGNGKVMIGGPASMATVTATDIEASNGVIHVIDTVILPN